MSRFTNNWSKIYRQKVTTLFLKLIDSAHKSENWKRLGRCNGKLIFGFIIASIFSSALYGQSISRVVIFETDFENGLPAEFSGAGNLTTSEGYSDFGFGNSYYRNASIPPELTLLTLNGLPAHTSLGISFDLAIIDSWDGSHFLSDHLNVAVDGTIVFDHTFLGANLERCKRFAL
ncbi:MAG TPA: hypothetical protein EYQ50_07285 [Verrucomicrobiales bacterium]|nr:hypothetical protein [Verrucomicrobiales bacterium]